MDRWNDNIPGGQGGPGYDPHYPPQSDPMTGGFYAGPGEDDDLVFIPDEDTSMGYDFSPWDTDGDTAPAEAGAEAPSPAESPEQLRAAKRKKGARRWRVFLLCWFVVLLLAGAVGCVTLYKYLAVYEQVRPERTMDILLETTPSTVWTECALQGLTADLSAFDNADELRTKYAEAFLQSGEFTYRKDTVSARAGERAFCIRTGGVDLCTVHLVEQTGKDLGFGLHEWKPGDIVPADGLRNLTSVTVTVDAMAKEKVSVNGKSLGESDLVDENVPIDDLCEVEKRMTQVPHLVRYRLDALYGSVTVTDGWGHEIAPEKTEDNVVSYVIHPEKHDLTVIAPDGTAVSVGGAVLGESEITGEKESILAGLEKYTGGQESRNIIYTVTGLYSTPEVKAQSSSGIELVPLVNEKGELRFFRPQDDNLKGQHQARVRQFFDNYIAYSSQAFDEGRQVNLLSCILPGTELYSYVENSRDAMIWASATQVSYDELSFEDFIPISEDCFTCTIRYKADFSAQSWYKQYTYDMQNAYEMAFVRQGDVWYAAAMSVISG